MTKRDCSEFARLWERRAALYAEFVAARDDLTMTQKDDPTNSIKKAEVKRIRGLLREAHRLEDSHRDSHNLADSI